MKKIFIIVLIFIGITSNLLASDNSNPIVKAYKQGGLKQAQKEYKKLIKEDNKNIDTYEGMASVYWEEKDIYQQEKILKECTKNNPKSFICFVYLGELYEDEIKDTDKAIEAYTNAINLTFFDSYFFRAKLYLWKKHDYNKAISDYKFIINYLEKEKRLLLRTSFKNYNEQMFYLNFGLAIAYEYNKNYKQALFYIDKALEYKSPDKMGNYMKADILLKEFISSDSKDFKSEDAYQKYFLTSCLSILNNYSIALEEAQKENDKKTFDMIWHDRQDLIDSLEKISGKRIDLKALGINI